jgi:acetyl esterase/lipase
MGRSICSAWKVGPLLVSPLFHHRHSLFHRFTAMLQYILLGTGLAVAATVFSVSSKALRGLYDHSYQVPGIVLRLSSAVVLVLVKYVVRGRKPRFAEWTLEAEITQTILRCFSINYPQRIVKPKNAAYLQQMLEKAALKSSEAKAREADVAIQYFTYNGLDHIWVRAREPQASPKKHRFVVLYFHGGGFVVGCPGVYIPMTGYLQRRIRELLTRELGHDVCVEFLLANYRKAPQFPYPRPPQDAYAMYKFLLEEEKLSPSQIMVMGDSAGGGLTMATLLRARDEDPSLLPAAAILSSPFVDRSCKRDDRESPNCFITAYGVETFWNVYHSGEGDPKTWGDASPVHCDLRDLPPVYIQATEFDHILPHSTRLYDKALQDGLTTWTLEIVPNVPHAYTSLSLSGWPTATKSLDKTSAFAASQLARAALARNGKRGGDGKPAKAH